ncbi:MAG: hypothetical protein V3T31_02305 [candidate division Zixibacteria bacterium]
MWRTECGERILEGSEVRVFAEALSGLLDEAISGTLDDYELGIRCFDDLTFGQRISVLATIGNGLLREDVPPIDLTAVVEGAIAAVFQHLKYQIIYEIDEPESRSNWRELVLAARKQTGGEIEGIPAPTCTDTKEWDFEVEQLSDRILWDVDYESGHIFMDHPPDMSEWLKDMADIPDDYFMAIADDLTDDEAKAQIKELKKLCNSVIEPS